MIWPNFRIGCALGDRRRRHLVAARHARARRDALGDRAGLDGIDRDDDIVGRVEPHDARSVEHGAFMEFLQEMGAGSLAASAPF